MPEPEGHGYVVNAYEVARATGIEYARPVTGRGRPGWAWGGVEYHDGGWDAMVAGSGVDRWVRLAVIGAWFPATIVEKAAELGLVRKGGKRLAWTEGRPCDETITGDWSSHRCERVAVGTKTLRGSLGGELTVCSLHQKAHEKSEARRREWEENWEASAARDRRREEHRALATELLEWAGPLLAELGIHPQTVTVGSIGDRTGILLPAEAVATLIQEATGERYPGRPEADS